MLHRIKKISIKMSLATLAKFVTVPCTYIENERLLVALLIACVNVKFT